MEECERLRWLGIDAETNSEVVSPLSTEFEMFISMYFVYDDEEGRKT